MNTLWPRALVVTPLKTRWLCDLPGRPSLLPGRRSPSRPSTPRALRVVGAARDPPHAVSASAAVPKPPGSRGREAGGARPANTECEVSSSTSAPASERRAQAGQSTARPGPDWTARHRAPDSLLHSVNVHIVRDSWRHVYIYIQVHPNRCECVTRGLRRRRVSRRRARRWLWGR